MRRQVFKLLQPRKRKLLQIAYVRKSSYAYNTVRDVISDSLSLRRDLPRLSNQACISGTPLSIFSIELQGRDSVVISFRIWLNTGMPVENSESITTFIR